MRWRSEHTPFRHHCSSVCVAILLGMVMLLAACGPAPIIARPPTPTPPPGPPPAPDSQQVLHTGLSGVPTLDPQFIISSDGYAVVHVVFPSLVQFDAHLQVKLWAASTYTVSPDGKTYTFTLRPGLKWSDGTAIGADDFAFAMNRALDPCVGSPLASFLYPILDASAFHHEQCAEGTPTGSIQTLIGDSLSVVDPQTLAITLQTPAAYFLAALGFPTSYAVPRALIKTYGDQWTRHLTDNGGMGGDLFKVTAWEQNRVVLQRNDAFWGTKPKLREVDFTVYNKPVLAAADAMYADYLNGNGDVSSVSAAQYDSASLRSDFKESGALAVQALVPNWTMAPFDDVRMRQAFALALDKGRLATDVYSGSVIASNHLVPSGMPGYNPALKGPDGTTNLSGNPDKAKALAQSYADEKCGGKLSACPTVTFTTRTDQVFGSLANEERNMWLQAMPGYPITIATDSVSTLLNELGTVQFEALSGIVADYPDPQDWLSQYFLPESASNISHADLPTATSLMHQADADQTQADRISKYNQAEQLLVTNVAWIPLFQDKNFFVKRPYVVEYDITGIGVPSSDTWQQTYIARH